MDRQQKLQEEQYSFPYHYIPQLRGDRFSPVRYWAWSHHYLGGFEVVFRSLESLDFESLVDIGCGDGRFLSEAAERYPERDVLGVDYSARAIELARALNPDVSYENANIFDDDLPRQFDAATMIEVLEHIPPQEVEAFLGAVARSITPGGSLIVTVPHVNKPLQAKHYQHFSSDTLRGLLSPRFASVEMIPFDRRSRMLRLLHRVLGGRGHHVVVTDRRLLSAFWKLYRKRFLLTRESRCLRIAAVCRGRLSD